MSRVEQARAWFADAEVITVVANTYRPGLTGQTRRVTKVGRSFFDAEVLDGPGVGTRTRGVLPTRARDVIEITDTTVTFRLGDLGRLAGHTVTYAKDKANR